MPNLIIIGNGFDLAHGLKTSYNDFILHLIDEQLQNENLDPPIFTCANEINDARTVIEHMKEALYRKFYKFHNNFFQRLLIRYSQNNWCDIELEYFKYLMEIAEGNVSSLSRFHTEFKEIISHLEKYLTSISEQPLEIDPQGSYYKFFRLIENSKSLILNFNYTKTVDKYLSEDKKNQIINIHGELNNPLNPIIFGFAADDQESRKLIEKGENDFLRFIKKHAYKITNNETRLRDFLIYGYIKVFFMGHSGGLSDKLILNQILNNENVESITMFYHKDHSSFFDFQVNIDRIMHNDKNFEKLVNFQDSIKMPQLNDDENTISDFTNYCNNALKNSGPGVH